MARGNSLLPVMMCLSIPYLKIAFDYKKCHLVGSYKISIMANFFVFASLCAYFYYHTLEGILEYYYFVGRVFDKILLQKLLVCFGFLEKYQDR